MDLLIFGLGVGTAIGFCTRWALDKTDESSRRPHHRVAPLSGGVVVGASRSSRHVHPTALGGRTVEAPLRNVKLIRDTSRDRRIRDLTASAYCADCGRPKPPSRLVCDLCGESMRAACLRIIEGDAS